MANFKRKKTKRCVRCTMCTQHRWLGNCPERFRVQYRSQQQPQLHNLGE